MAIDSCLLPGEHSAGLSTRPPSPTQGMLLPKPQEHAVKRPGFRTPTTPHVNYPLVGRVNFFLERLRVSNPLPEGPGEFLTSIGSGQQGLGLWTGDFSAQAILAQQAKGSQH